MAIYNARIIEVDAAETRRYAGLRKAQNFGEQNIRDACAEAVLLIDVGGVWEIYDYDNANHVVKSEPPFTIAGNSIIKHLDGCERVICMAATVGFDIEREISRKFERGEYLASILLDAAATAAVEQVADEMEKHFASTFARDGFKLRWRFSPGYGDWALTEQAKLFDAAGASRIGLTLTSAMMLEPRKSVTAIIGLERVTKAQPLQASKKFCATCDKINCPSRTF